MALVAEWITFAQGENYFTLRFYPTQEAADAMAPYDTVATCRMCGDTAYLFALNGRITRQYREDIEQWLRANGMNSAKVTRHGREVTYWRDTPAGVPA